MRNSEGERILEFAVTRNLQICNSVFKNKENLITCESGGVANVIEYMLTRVGDRETVQNRNTIPGEEYVSQHRLLICGSAE